MDQFTLVTAGVDIVKYVLDVHLHPGESERRFSNDAKGHRALITRLTQHRIVRVVYEATGAYPGFRAHSCRG